MKNEQVIKEAEMIVANYIKQMNNKKKEKEQEKAKMKKYNRLKKYAYIATAIMIIQFLVNIFK